MSDVTDLAVMSHGERMMAPLSQPAEFSDPVGRHHRAFYDDYDVAKAHVMQAIGDVDGFEVFGRQVLCAVFVRPNITPKGFYLGTKDVKEDWWQHKIVLVLKLGPDAFKGDESYIRAVFGAGVKPPQVGDWLVSNANSGLQLNWRSDTASRPQGKDHRGDPIDLFEWDGWPCRMMADDNFIGRITKPHSVV